MSLAPVPHPIVTGASGFIGAALLKRLEAPRTLAMGREDWAAALAACDFRGSTVIHLAARVHDPRAPESAFEVDNVRKTRALAEAAASGGALRFVFASTVKVFGEESGSRAFAEGDDPRPEDAYARSKWRAEQAAREVERQTGIPVVVVRIPLTYGPRAGGNFGALVRLADTAWWLPFARIANRRSVVHVDDLVDALLVAAAHPAAAGRTLLAVHPEPVSTPRLVGAIRHALGRPARLFGVAPALLELGAAVAGQADRMRRLTRSLEVDPGALVRELGWLPRMGLEAGIRACLQGSKG